ncbi:helix-turn-helix domain-containing protein [Phytohabitans suffuscus]|uniref:Transcriptional regulator n=1 Tax=Phytohabitans suffuscus TaxID=624315 RepID=A0A6F8YEJ8_9ACTN|nr:helix-turn-helix transcriptional regulator [Phytohabitans suffuscus]BCB84453.1 transcriptional regulator [Phytohabitans suffuscus]
MSSQVHQAKQAFGARLREIRKDASLTGRALAAATGLHVSKVSRIEHAGQNPSEEDIRRWCQACKADDQIPELIATLRGIEGMWLEWKRQLRGGLKRMQETFDRHHERASVVRSYESIVVPGILQTAAYCEAVLRIAADFYGTDGDIAAAVEARMNRQRFLYQSDRRFLFVVEAWALRTIFGGVDVMLGQLDRLLAVATLPRVSFGVIPPGRIRQMWPGEGFFLFDDDLAVIETTSAEIKVTQPQEIRLFADAFRRLQGEAVFGAEARGLITGTMDDLAVSEVLNGTADSPNSP